MKKLIGFIFVIFFLILSNVIADGDLIDRLKEGKKIIFIRHAYAPGNGDPKNFNLNDCFSQRNLNKEGIQQSKEIGFFFKKNKIPIDKILSSEWCRCKDTAKYAFKEYETFRALNSFYDKRFIKYKEEQIDDLKLYLKNWNKKKNLILITHFVVISEILNVGTSPGEIIILDKNLNIIGNINISN